MELSRPQKAERAIFAVREVVHDLPVYQTRGMASAVDVGGKQCLLTWKGVFNEGDRAPTNHKSVKFHQSSRYKEKNYQLGKSKIGQAGRFSFIPVEGLQSCDALMLIVPGSNVIENDVCAQSFIGGKKLLKFKFQYIEKEQKHVLTSFEGKKCTIEKFAVLGSPIINDKGVIGVVGEDADGQLIPCFITQTELDHKEKNSSESGNSEDLDTEDSAGQHKQASHSTDSAAQPSVLQSSEEKHQEKDPSEGETGNVPYAPAPAPPSHQPISGTSQEECKELREERHKLASEHEENDPSEGGTGNVPYAPGGPGETTKDLENVKHVIRESKRESKEVPTRDITDGLIEAVSDMGLIVSDNDGKGNCLFHALSEQLETVKKIKIPHDELRKTLVQYLKENPETKDGADLYSMLDENQRTRFGGWDEYLTDMAKDGIWGDEMILFAAANHFKTVIYVISSPPGKERQEIPVRPECKVEDENPIWLGRIYDCHFVSLLKAPVPPSHQPFNGTSQEECKELEEERHKLVFGRNKPAASSTDSVVQSSQSSKEILRSGQFCSKDLPYLALDIQATKKWKVIRTELDVSDGELSGIDDNYERCYMMIKIWLNKNGKRASYEKLAEVLKRVGLSAIRTNYCLEGNHPPSQEIEDIHTFENVKQQEIRESDLMEIGNKITKKCYRLGRVLGVQDSKLEQIKENYREKILEQSYWILKRWQEAKGRDATYTALAQALLDRTVALKDILEEFCLEK